MLLGETSLDQCFLASIQDVESCGVGGVAKWRCLSYTISPVVQVEMSRKTVRTCSEEE